MAAATKELRIKHVPIPGKYHFVGRDKAHEYSVLGTAL